jgi:hypothetical protein
MGTTDVGCGRRGHSVGVTTVLRPLSIHVFQDTLYGHALQVDDRSVESFQRYLDFLLSALGGSVCV